VRFRGAKLGPSEHRSGEHRPGELRSGQFGPGQQRRGLGRAFAGGQR